MFNEWKRVPGSSSKVEIIQFSFSSLFENEEPLGKIIPEGQLSLFDFEMTNEKLSLARILDIKQVYQIG